MPSADMWLSAVSLVSGGQVVDRTKSQGRMETSPGAHTGCTVVVLSRHWPERWALGIKGKLLGRSADGQMPEGYDSPRGRPWDEAKAPGVAWLAQPGLEE